MAAMSSNLSGRAGTGWSWLVQDLHWPIWSAGVRLYSVRARTAYGRAHASCPGSPSEKSSTLAPSSRFSNSARTGIRGPETGSILDQRHSSTALGLDGSSDGDPQLLAVALTPHRPVARHATRHRLTDGGTSLASCRSPAETRGRSPSCFCIRPPGQWPRSFPPAFDAALR